MIKFVGGIVVGVFMGALVLEVIGRTRPALLKKVQDQARGAASRVGDFVAGEPSERPAY